MKCFRRPGFLVLILLVLVMLVSACTGSQGAQGVKGVKGDTGDQGLVGLKGATGDQGDQGAQGAKGETGDTRYAKLILGSNFLKETGGTLHVIGSGFEPGERISISILRSDRVVAVGGAVANDVGSFYEVYAVRAAAVLAGAEQGFPAGAYTVRAKGDQESQATAPLVTTP